MWEEQCDFWVGHVPGSREALSDPDSHICKRCGHTFEEYAMMMRTGRK